MTPAAVLLDMDGTLVDSDASVERAWTTWAGEHGVDPTDVMAIAHGSPADRTVRRVLPDLDDDGVGASARRQLELQYDDLADVRALAGAHELVAVLERRRIPWAVVTSADARLARARLGAAGLDPPLLVTVEDVSQGKPHPEGYLLAAQRLGVEPADCLVVEDAEPGVEAGRAAGMRVAALKGLAADVRLRDLGQLALLLSVRPATAADAATCAAVYAPYVTDTVITFELVPPTVAEMAERIADATRTHAWLVLEDDGRTVGYAYAHPMGLRAAYRWSCEVSIYLERGRTGSGGGRALYEALLTRLAERGFRTVVAGMTLPNDASEGLHRAMGFVPVGTQHRIGWKHGAWRDVAWVQRPIGEPVDPPAEPR